jgi:hypothetical protein
MVDHKVLERIRVFLVYVAITYKSLDPFLLGLHLTIGSWRTGRNEEGWRLRQAEAEARLEYDEESEREYWKGADQQAPPVLVGTVPI